LIILVEKYKNVGEEDKGNIFNFYLKNTKNINNWDLVDISAPNIVGDFLFGKKKNVLYELANSNVFIKASYSATLLVTNLPIFALYFVRIFPSFLIIIPIAPGPGLPLEPPSEFV
ncbi:unnamed protein product, partial [marine sediment metagenome]